MAILSCHVSIKLPPKISDGQLGLTNMFDCPEREVPIAESTSVPSPHTPALQEKKKKKNRHPNGNVQGLSQVACCNANERMRSLLGEVIAGGRFGGQTRARGLV